MRSHQANPWIDLKTLDWVVDRKGQLPEEEKDGEKSCKRLLASFLKAENTKSMSGLETELNNFVLPILKWRNKIEMF